NATANDLMGHARVYGAVIDMGAYEHYLTADGNGVVYVKDLATGGRDGSSWANATADLQGAIDAPGTQNVFVALGTYKVKDRSFIMKNDVAIYGGFDPANNITALEDRILPNKGMN